MASLFRSTAEQLTIRTGAGELTLSVGTYSGNVGGNIKIGGNFTFTGSGSLDFGTTPVTNTANHTITISANTLAIGGVISGLGNGLTIAGNGILSLYGVSTYTGNTTVNGGTLALTNAGSISSSAQVAVNSATFDVSGLASGSTTLIAFSPTNSTLDVDLSSSSVINVQASTLNVGGATNIINIEALRR